MKIAMVVYNTVSKDARVLKEAASLTEHGHEVTVFGIHDNNSKSSVEILPNNVRIERAFWRHYSFMWIAWIIALGTLTAVLLLTLFVFPMLSDVAFFIEERYADSSSLLLTIHVMFVAVILLIILRSSRYIKKFYALYWSYRSLECRDGQGLSGKISNGIKYLVRRSIANLSMQNGVVPLIKKYNPDVIHCHDLMTVPAGISIKKALNIPLVYDSHEIYEEQASFGWPQKKVFSLLQRYVSKHVDYFITINDSIAEFLIGKYKSLPKPIIIKNATKAVSTQVVYDGRLHKAADLDIEKKILLYQGGFGPKRGLDQLVRAAKDLPDEWVLVMMGWGALEDSLKQIANQVDPNKNKVRFVPGAPHSELVHWTAGGSLGVIPYENVNLNHWFCTPNKLWEYPSAGVPILASDFPEMAKVITEHDIGLLLPTSLTAKSISNAVANISDTELSRMKTNCYEYISTDNWAIYHDRLVKLYLEIEGR